MSRSLRRAFHRLGPCFAVLIATSGSCGCGAFGPRLAGDCSLGDPREQAPSRPALVDLSLLELYRNTFAVTRVGPYEDHFTLWFHDIEPTFVQLRARRDPRTGHVHIEVDHGMWGGIGMPPESPAPAPASVAALARSLEREVRDRCPDASGWVLQYDGAYREVDLVEVMPVRPGRGTRRVGWHGTLTLAADEQLSHLAARAPHYESGDGLIEMGEPVQWVSFAPPAAWTGTTLVVDRLARSKGAPAPASPEGILIQAALEAARRLQASAPSPPLAELVAAQGASLLPPGMEQRLHVWVSLYARPKKGIGSEQQQSAELAIPLETSEVAFGTARGEAEVTVGGVLVKAQALLAPVAPLTKDTASHTMSIEATLQVRVQDTEGHVFERTYPARGEVIVEATTAVAPAGFGIPGASGPSKEMDALHGQLPGKGDFEVIDIYLRSGVTDDPRVE